MIRIYRSPAPTALTRRGPHQTQLDCADYEAAPEDYKSGSQTLFLQGVLQE